jgi:hypothetical protein
MANRHDGGWGEVPLWALDMLEMQYFTILQNEMILAELQKRSTRLSDKDQKALDQLTTILKGTNTKIDSAKKDA